MGLYKFFKFFSISMITFTIMLRLFLPGLTVEIGENALVSLCVLISFTLTLCTHTIKKENNNLPYYTIFPLVWIAFCLISTCWSTNIINTLSKTAWWFSDILLFFTIWYWCYDIQVKRYLISLILSLFMLEVVYGLYQHYIALPIIPEYVQSNPTSLQGIDMPQNAKLMQSMPSIFGHFTISNTLGGYYILYLPLLFLMTFSLKFKNKKIFITHFIFLVLSFLALYHTHSRGSIIAIIATIFLYLFYCIHKKYGKKVAYLVSIIIWCLSIVFLCATTTKIFNPIIDHFLSFVFREGHWSAGYEIWKSHPFLGIGINNFSQYYYLYKEPWVQETQKLHQSFFQVFIEIGIIGFLTYILMIVQGLRLINTPLQSSNKKELENKTTEKIYYKNYFFMVIVLFLFVWMLLYKLDRFFDFDSIEWYLAKYSNILCSCFLYLLLLIVFSIFFITFWIVKHYDLKTIQLGFKLALLSFFIHNNIDIDFYDPGISQQIWIIFAFLMPVNPPNWKIPHWVIKLGACISIFLTLYFSSCVLNLIEIAQLKEKLLFQEQNISNSKQKKQEYLQTLSNIHKKAPYEVTIAIKLCYNEMNKLYNLLHSYGNISTDTIQEYFDKAEKSLQKVRNINRQNLQLEYTFVKLYLLQRKIFQSLHYKKESIESLLQAQKLIKNVLIIYPYKVQLLQTAAEIEEQLGNYTQAKQYYKKMLLSNDHLQQLNKKEINSIIQKINSLIQRE